MKKPIKSTPAAKFLMEGMNARQTGIREYKRGRKTRRQKLDESLNG